jgi:hypothetical protein
MAARREGAKLIEEFLFVSCDIVAHSAEPSLDSQRENIREINAIVANLLADSVGADAIWASGGDGGHIALPNRPPTVIAALDLLLEFRRWSRRKGVRLRLCGSVGEVDRVRGADGREQLVGPGINVAGRLLPYGSNERVVLTEAFRVLAQETRRSEFHYHDALVIAPRNSPSLDVCLLSVAGEFLSTWLEPDSHSDRALLGEALASRDALAVVYRARRLLELSSSDPDADRALRCLDGMMISGKRNFLHKLLQDEHVGPHLIRLGNLIERRAGEILCSHGDSGTSMFMILRGRIQVFFPNEAEPARFAAREKSVVMGPGELGGELAFALRRSRTATLQCLEDTALLTFTYQELIQSFSASNDQMRAVEEALAREIRAKVLENFCNTAAFFQPVLAAAVAAVRDAPSQTLLPFTSLVPVSQSRVHLTIPGEGIGGDGLCFLVSGRLRLEATRTTIEGLGYPLIHAHLPPAIVQSPVRVGLVEDCQLLCIQRDGLLRFGLDALDVVITQAIAALADTAVHPAKQLVDVGASKKSHIARDCVFISYCHENEEAVRRIRDALAFAGERVWWDKDILVGKDWKHEIREALRRSYAVVCCLSSELGARAQSGLYSELREAIDAFSGYAPGQTWVVPVRLSECEIPPLEIGEGRTLDRIQCLDLFPQSHVAEGFEKLIVALREARKRFNQ